MKALKGFFVGLFFTPFFQAEAQLTATDTSANIIRRYQNIVRSNQQLVNYIEYTLASNGIPKHMRNLAIIESGLNHNIESWVGAMGVWQFMPGHASDYGLHPDERNDMYKSTQIAAKSLKDLYRKYNNWVTVVAAYNCGTGNIAKAMKRAGSTRYTDFAPFLPLETQNHVKKYLNMSFASGELSEVLDDYYKTNTSVIQPAAAPVAMAAAPSVPAKKIAFKTNAKKGNLDHIILNGAYNLDVISKYLKISKKEILKWNPGLEKMLMEKGEAPFYLSANLMMDFRIKQAEILSESLKSPM